MKRVLYFKYCCIERSIDTRDIFLNASPIPLRLVLVLVLVVPLPDDSASSRPIEHSVNANVGMYFRSIDLIRWCGMTWRFAVTEL